MGSQFNSEIIDWKVSKVTTMRRMFAGSLFNQDITDWTVSAVVDMDNMFNGNAVFNQAIQGWQVSSLATARGTFYKAAAFNQSLCDWRIDLPPVTLYGDTFVDSACPNIADPDVFNNVGPFCNNCDALTGSSSPTATPVNGIFDTTDELRLAVLEVMATGSDVNAPVFQRYGLMEDWNVTLLTSLDGVFLSYTGPVAGNLNGWDVSNVVSMDCKCHIDAWVQKSRLQI
jgi:Mycoplasma protein of unknown function, DUF285